MAPLHQKKLTGPEAGVQKYDLITAVMTYGLHANPTIQTSLARLIALTTARYNWRLDEVSVGHTELARLWAVNVRTVKREMKRLSDLGVLICIRPGVRGRVGAYRLDIQRIYTLTEPVWADIGSDFVERMQRNQGLTHRTVVQVDFSQTRAEPDTQPQDAGDAVPGTWAALRQRLSQEHPAIFRHWFAKLNEQQLDGSRLVLTAPNRFVADYIATHLVATLEQAASQEFDREMEICLHVSKS